MSNLFLMAAAKKRAAGGNFVPYWNDTEWVLNLDTGSYIDLKNGHPTTLDSPGTVVAGTGLTSPTGSNIGYIKIDSVTPIANKDFVLEAWMSLATTSTFNNPYVLAVAPDTFMLTGTGFSLYLLDGGGGAPVFATAGQPNLGDYVYIPGLTANRPFHIALVRTGTNYAMYANKTRLWLQNPGALTNLTATSHFIGGNPEAEGTNRSPTMYFHAARLTYDTDRGYAGATIVPENYPFLVWELPTYSKLDPNFKSPSAIVNPETYVLSHPNDNQNYNVACRMDTSRTSGRYYIEVTQLQNTGQPNGILGLVASNYSFADTRALSQGPGYSGGWHPASGGVYTDANSGFIAGTGPSGGAAQNFVYGMAVDIYAKKVWFSRNTNVNVYTTAAMTWAFSGEVWPAFNVWNGFVGGESFKINVGQEAYAFTPPAGFGPYIV